MKTFRHTVPEPSHRRQGYMAQREFDYWERVRARGPEWFVVSKGLLFLAVVPVAAHFAAGLAVSPELLCVSWLSGLVAGTTVWLRRERRYRSSLEAGMQSRRGLPRT